MGKLTVKSGFYNTTVPLALMLNNHVFSKRIHNVMENFLGNQISALCVTNSSDQVLVTAVS